MRLNSLSSVLVLGLMGGCGFGENNNLKVELAELTKDVKGKVAPIPEIKPYDPYPYAATELPDPFKPAVVKTFTSASPTAYESEWRRVKEPLEASPLESIKMVGTLSRPGDGMTALVKSDAGLAKVVVGRYLGQNYGKIKSISPTQIELRELFQDSGGVWTERTATLELEDNQVKK